MQCVVGHYEMTLLVGSQQCEGLIQSGYQIKMMTCEAVGSYHGQPSDDAYRVTCECGVTCPFNNRVLLISPPRSEAE